MSKRRGHHNVGWPAPPARRRGRPRGATAAEGGRRRRRRAGAAELLSHRILNGRPPYFAPPDVIRAAGCWARLEPCARAE